MKTVIATVLATVLMSGISFAQESLSNEERAKYMQSRIDSVEVGKPMPEFTMLNERHETVPFSSLKGKVVVIDIWATWCKPCIALSPEFEKVKEEIQDDEVVFLSVSVDEKQDKWTNYIEEHSVNYDRYWVGKNYDQPILWFTFGQFEYQGQEVWAESIPRFVIVDKNGIIRALDFGRPGMSAFKKAIKKAKK